MRCRFTDSGKCASKASQGCLCGQMLRAGVLSMEKGFEDRRCQAVPGELLPDAGAGASQGGGDISFVA